MFDPTQFGLTMGRLVSEYRGTYASIALIPHVAILVLLPLLLWDARRFRRIFAIYFAINYVWILLFQGVWFSYEMYRRLGLVALCVYGATPILLLLILYSWIRESVQPRLDADCRSFESWRLLIALPMFVWGFWYPPYDWGVRLVFDLKELLFGAYGLMGCPTTMVALSVPFLKYPSV